MPIFEFRCLGCGNLFEKIFLNPSERADLQCPDCGGTSLERVVSKSNHVMGVGRRGKQPKVTSKSCGSGNSCVTLGLPGPTKP
ncbi:MAG: zinc ribbon domain-containing protein [Deltaproteobacteria bacterium]|nr:zinc ribbon domain-containing protein [Deltaproteobacteria bacterium]MBW2137304.1 zinc ribbon domain-containing protein [Deltaproteobacteria bacterium]